jgi:hypothetical protein
MTYERTLAMAFVFLTIVSSAATFTCFSEAKAATQVRDHRDEVKNPRAPRPHRANANPSAGANGGVTVTPGKPRPAKVPCLGNLC